MWKREHRGRKRERERDEEESQLARRGGNVCLREKMVRKLERPEEKKKKKCGWRGEEGRKM